MSALTTSPSSRIDARPVSGGRALMDSIGAEWTKLWSLRSTYWCLASAVVLMMAWAGVVGFDYSFADDEHPAPTTPMAVGDTAIQATQLAQFALLSLAMLVITSEYSTGSIRSTLQSVPARGRMLASKAVVLGVVTLVAGVVLAALGCLAGWAMLGELGSFEGSELTKQVFSIAAYLALSCLFTLAIGVLVRSPVATLSLSLLLLLLLPLLLQGVTLDVVKTATDYLPGSAGLNLLEGDGDPYGRGVGVLVLGAWSIAALLFGGVVLRRRDA